MHQRNIFHYASRFSMWIFVVLMLACFFADFSSEHDRNNHQFPSYLSVAQAGVSGGPNPVVKPSPWPHEKSDLAPDPALVFGSLPNGFRYVLMENHTPRNRVSMNLNIAAGSMNETDNQKGLAHFLEHMLFNGSTHFKPGELVKYFQSIGMQFGADANARTGFYETVYNILLPKGDEKRLKEGFLVLKDYAEGASLLPSEIDRERKVILAEKRTRDSASYRTYIAALKFELPETRLLRRLPIGQTDLIQDADRKRLKDYYDTWYRPENMVLVIAGDFDPHLAARLINEAFSGVSARAPQRAVPAFGEINHQGIKPFYHFEKESGHTTVTLKVLKKVSHEPDDVALQKKLLLLGVADRIIQNRLDSLVKQPDTPFTDASIGSGIFLRHLKTAMITAEGAPENWKRMLSLLDQTLRSALKHGFDGEELERVKKDILARLDAEVKKSNTRDSRFLAHMIIHKLNNGRVFQSPQQEKDLFGPLVESMALEQVQDAFRQAWASDHRLVLVTGNADLKTDKQRPEDKILALFNRSQTIVATKNPESKPVTFPYLPDPEKKGRIVKKTQIAGLGITQIDFDNGVRLNLKQTDFQADEVLVNLTFGSGRSAEPGHRPGLAKLSEAVINESGLGSLGRDDLKRAMAGKNTNLRFVVEEDHFAFKGRTVSNEIRLLFQLLYAHLTDPGYREDAFKLSMQRFSQMYTALSRSVEGKMKLSGSRFLAGGDHRFGLPPHDAFKKLTLEDVRSWMDTALKSKPLEVSVVGDFDPNAMVDIAATYLGSLPPRSSFGGKEPSETIHFPVNQYLKLNIATDIPKSLVAVAYPTADLWDIRRTRRLSVLGEIFSDRLRERLRENLGAAYSPYAYNRPWRAYPGYGVFQAVVLVDPARADQVVIEIKEIISDLSRNGVNSDELKRALEPNLTGIKDLIRTNDYWLNTVLTGSKRHPEQTAWSRTIQKDYTAITPEELSRLAQKYLDNRKAATIVIEPS